MNIDVVLGCIAVLGCAAVVHAAPAEDGTITKSFQVAAGGRLLLETDRGTIDIRPVDTPTRLDVEVRDATGMTVEFTQHGADVQIHGKATGGFWRWLWSRQFWRGPQFVVTVPHQYNVDLRTSGGAITVGDLEGEVRSRTSGGSIHLGRIRGPVSGETSGGSIRIAESIHSAEVKTSGGSIQVDTVEGEVIACTSGGAIHIGKATGRVVAETSGGGITVQEAGSAITATTSGGAVMVGLAGQPQDDSRLQTSGGSVVVLLAETIGLDIDARTSGGRVTTELLVTVQGEFSTTALQAKMNAGGPKLVLRTSGGDIAWASCADSGGGHT